jgi:hypothetical protein
MEVVHPLGVEPISACLGCSHDAGAVEVGLRDEIEGTAGLLLPFAEGIVKEVPDTDGVPVEDLMDGVDAKPVDVIIFCPVEDVPDDKVFYAVGPGTVVVECFSPGCLVFVREKGAIERKTIAFGADMIIYNI